ncbi:MAG: MFS transporter [Verrucomicrobia bacterium]|nr:MFS transporter [Verrucomicrobiota bacterium]
MVGPPLSAPTAPARFRWVIVGMIFLATVINYLCRQAYSVSATTLQQVFSLSNEDYGLLTSGFFFAYAISNGISGPVIDRLGAKRGYLLCMFVWSSAVGLIGAAQNVWMLAGFLMLLGLGEAGNWPAAVKVVGEWFPPRERALASGIFNSGAGIGALIGPTAVGLLLIHVGWRPAFVSVGLIGYAWLIGFGLVYRTPTGRVTVEAARPPSPWRLLKTRFLVCFALSKVFMDPVWYFYVFWLPKFLTDVHHFDLKQIVWLAPIPFIVADIGNLAGGGFTQLLIARGLPIPHARKTGAACFGLLMVSAIPAILIHDAYWSIALVSVAMFGYTGYLANTLAFPAEVFPNHALGSIWGLASVGSGLGGMLFQWLSGRLVDRFGYQPVFIGYGIMPLIAVVIVLFLLGPLRPHPDFQPRSAGSEFTPSPVD